MHQHTPAKTKLYNTSCRQLAKSVTGWFDSNSTQPFQKEATMNKKVRKSIEMWVAIVIFVTAILVSWAVGMSWLKLW
jgi:hypothetical protein